MNHEEVRYFPSERQSATSVKSIWRTDGKSLHMFLEIN